MAVGDESYFLDTSTQIKKHWGDEKIKLPLTQELSDKRGRCYCSIYVRNEYKYRVLTDSILVYNTIVKSKNLGKAKKNLDEAIGREELPYKVFRRYFKQFKTKERILTRLERLIELGWKYDFSTYINRKLFDIVKCKFAQDDPCKKGQIYKGIIDKCPSNCDICNFLSVRHDDLELLSNIDTTKLDQTVDPKSTLRDTQRVASEILSGTRPNSDHCRTISDSIISIEARDSHREIILLSMDADFGKLGKVLSIPTRVFR